MAYTKVSPADFEAAIERALRSVKYGALSERFLAFWNKVKKAIANLLEKLFGYLDTGENNYSGKMLDFELMSTILLIVALVLIILLIVFAVRKWRKSLKGFTTIIEDENEALLMRYGVNELTELAVGFEKNEQYAQALRYHFIALIKNMYEKGIIDTDERKTNGRIALELDFTNSPYAKGFNGLVTGFNAVCYGKRAPNAEEYFNWAGRLNTLMKEVGAYE